MAILFRILGKLLLVYPKGFRFRLLVGSRNVVRQVFVFELVDLNLNSFGHFL